MLDSQGALTDAAFLEELSREDESETTRAAVAAGLAVLRLVRAWAAAGGAPAAQIVPPVRAAIDDLTERTPMRAILASVVEALESSPGPSMQSVAPRLIAYGQALEYEAKMALAAEVYRTVIAYTHPAEDADMAIMAHLRLGFCLYMRNDMEGARCTYAAAGQLGETSGDVIGVLRARIGEAQIAMRRGNLPRAEEILDDTIARAAAPELRDVRSRALHDRSAVAYLRGDYRLAGRLAEDSLQCCVGIQQRERVLANIAGIFAALGVLDTARDAYLVLATTAQEQLVRWASALNLLEITAREMARPPFERFRRELESADLPPDMMANFHLIAGQGYGRLGEPHQARSYLERARTLAEEPRFGQILFEAERELRMLPTRRDHVPDVSADVPEDLLALASRIREMREATVDR